MSGVKEKQAGKLFFYTDPEIPKYDLTGIVFREPFQKQLNDLDPPKHIIIIRRWKGLLDGHQRGCFWLVCGGKQMNIKYLIKQDVRNMIIDHLRRMGSFEHYSDEEIWDAMGYTPEELMIHLQNQFFDNAIWGDEEGRRIQTHKMSWGNYRSRWVIAHDVPMSIHHFQTIRCYNFQEAWKLENIRPMWKEDFSSRAKHKKIILVDVDGTILTSDPNHDYMKSEPIKKRIDVINKLYDSGKYIIIYYTARGSVHDKDWYSVTKEQLQRVGAKFDILKTTKCYYDHQIDDRSWNDVHFFNEPTAYLDLEFPENQ